MQHANQSVIKLCVPSFYSIGLEDPDDLIRDFDQALEKIPV